MYDSECFLKGIPVGLILAFSFGPAFSCNTDSFRKGFKKL